MLNIGDRAPNFTLKDKNGNDIRLSDFIGKRVVLYFYPKDNTPGCTRQACAFAGAYEEFKTRGVEVIGISPTESHLTLNLQKNITFPSYCSPTPISKPFKHTVCGKRRSFTERLASVLFVPRSLSMRME